jgi:hypothetical protein
MEQLAIKRIFFLGDEVTQEQAMSLYMLMKLPVLLSVDDDESFERTVQCTGGAGGSGGSDYSFQIVFLRKRRTPRDAHSHVPQGRKGELLQTTQRLLSSMV